MKSSNVSVAEGKREFSRLIKDASSKKEEIVITKRGKPVAVIVPYDEYVQSKKVEGYRKIMEARETFLKSGISSDEIYRASKKQLEKRS
jgi:prevent-host-death family protein